MPAYFHTWEDEKEEALQELRKLKEGGYITTQQYRSVRGMIHSDLEDGVGLFLMQRRAKLY